MKDPLIVFTTSLIAGGSVAWSLREPPPQPTRPEIAPAPSPRAPEPRKWGGEDFMKLIAEAGTLPLADGETFNPLANQLASWGDEEIRKALDEIVASPESVLDSGPGHELARNLIAEWMRRDLSAALAWFESIPSELTRGELSGSVSFNWPAEKAEEGLAYAAKHPGFFSGNGGSNSWKIVNRAIGSAAKRGPDAVAACLALVRENGLLLSGDPAEFPPGFDFAALAANPEVALLREKHERIFFADAWLRQDPEAAFEAITASALTRDGNPVRDLFSTGGSKQSAGEIEMRARLLADWLGNTDADSRRGLIEKSVKEIVMRSDILEALVKNLAEPGDRELVHAEAFCSIRSIGTAAALTHLEAYGDPTARLELLESFEARKPVVFGRGKMTSEEEGVLRRKLAEWGASPEKTERIVGKLHGILK